MTLESVIVRWVEQREDRWLCFTTIEERRPTQDVYQKAKDEEVLSLSNLNTDNAGSSENSSGLHSRPKLTTEKSPRCSAVLCAAAHHEDLKHIWVAPTMFLTPTVSCCVARQPEVIALGNNTEYERQDALGRPTEQNQCNSHLFCSFGSCSVSSFLPSCPPASSPPFTPNITFRILQSARELMENSSTISAEVNLWIQATLIWGHRTRAAAFDPGDRLFLATLPWLCS